MKERPFPAFCGGIATGILIVVLYVIMFPKWSCAYNEGVRDTHKEAFANGLMAKEIDKDDKVIYRWVELHKLQEGE